MAWRIVLIGMLALASASARAQACYQTSVTSPGPLMGNHGEIFKTADGGLFEVFGSYEYLYAYHPMVTICPGRGKMIVEGKTIGITELGKARRPVAKREEGPDRKKEPPPTVERRGSIPPIEVVLKVKGCDYFLADGPHGWYVLQHYGGHDPDKGDGIYGEIRGYGFIDVIYGNGSEGRLYVDNYMLGRDRALERVKDKCQ